MNLQAKFYSISIALIFSLSSLRAQTPLIQAVEFQEHKTDESTIDTIITQRVTAFNLNPNLISSYHLYGPGWEGLLHYCLLIKSRSDTLLFVQGDSKKTLYELPKDLQAKQDRFLRELPTIYYDSLLIGDSRREEFKSLQGTFMLPFYESIGYNATEAKSLTDAFWKYYQNKTIVLLIWPDETVGYAFDPHINKLVSVYCP